MSMNVQKGFASSVVIGIVALLVIGGGAWVIVKGNKAPKEVPLSAVLEEADGLMEAEDTSMKSGTDAMDSSDGALMMKSDSEARMETKDEVSPREKGSGMATGKRTFEATGTVLAGSTNAPLLTFNQADYEAALAAGNTVLLWYYADWCPTCKAEQEQIIAAFNAFNGTGIVGFRVNINDNNTDENEIATARKFGVSFRHTKVAVVGEGQERIFKTTEVWNKDHYATQLNAWAHTN